MSGVPREMPAALLFDFDGVILDSVEIKTDAFRRLFEDEAPDHIRAIVDLHRRHGGMSRYTKLDIIHRDILRRPLPATRKEALGRRFQALVLEAVIACAEIPGARDVLNSWRGHVPMIVVSGTPQDELKHIVASRNLGSYWTELHGSPRKKPEIIADALARHGLTTARCPFVGDALGDWEAAHACGLPFLGVVAPGLANPYPPGITVMRDLTEMPAGLEAIGFFGAPANVETAA